LTAIRLGELVLEAGFPAGVINIVTGYGRAAGQALVDHPGVDKISFTGSTQVGKAIAAACAQSLRRFTLELGGKSPVIVFPDADLQAAAAGTAMGIFMNAGQVCVAGSRLYVHRKAYDRVIEAVSRRAQTLKVGSGQLPDTEMGPLVSEKQLERVTAYIESARSEGGSVVTGGARIGRTGYFVQPTVVSDTRSDMTVRREEIFGPVICAMPFDDDDLDLIAAQANDSVYGLSASVWTRNISVAHKLARKIKAGTVRINGGVGLDFNLPFGGYKQSGIGRENGSAGVEAFTEVKSVSVAL
jgi:phenylacetaldehyde dehydrogenase